MSEYDVSIEDETAEVDDVAIDQDTDTDGDVVDESSQENAEDEWDPEPYGYTYKGQMFYPKSREHMRTLLQQAHMATQKQAELKKREQELQGMQSKYSPYEKLDEAFNKNPQFKQEIMQMYAKYAGGQQSGQQEYNEQQAAGASIPPEVLSKIERLESFVKSQENKQFDQELQNEIEKLKSNHEDHDWDVDDGEGTLVRRVMLHAHENGFPSLEAAYRDMHWEQVQVNARSNALKAQKEKRLKDRQRGVVMDGSISKQPPPQQSDRGKSYNQIAADILKNDLK